MIIVSYKKSWWWNYKPNYNITATYYQSWIEHAIYFLLISEENTCGHTPLQWKCSKTTEKQQKWTTTIQPVFFQSGRKEGSQSTRYLKIQHLVCKYIILLIVLGHSENYMKHCTWHRMYCKVIYNNISFYRVCTTNHCQSPVKMPSEERSGSPTAVPLFFALMWNIYRNRKLFFCLWTLMPSTIVNVCK